MNEIVTKLKVSHASQSGEMVDNIIRNLVFDFAYWYELLVSGVVLQQLREKKAEISSAVSSAAKVPSGR